MRRQAEFLHACAIAAALSISACASRPPAPAAEIHRIVSTTSFGMCIGYCRTRLEIAEGQAVLVREGRGGRGQTAGPDQRFAVALSAAEWEAFQRLAADANLEALPPVIGCPDCADGGAETLTIDGAGAPQTITIEYDAPIAQAQPLLDRIRALRARLMPE